MAAFFCSEALAENTCALKLPPKFSAISADHGAFFFVYPRKIQHHFTGCQTMWNEQGKKAFVLRFKNGTLVKYSSSYGSGIQAACDYRKGKLAIKNSGNCPDYQDVKNGLLNVDQSDEPEIPKDRDIHVATPTMQ